MNYKSLLAEISNAAMAPNNSSAIAVPSNKQLYTVDLNTRTINAPEILSIQSDHYAETVYFLVDRYYDSMDLAQTNCVIQYAINNQAYVYAVPFCDVTTYENKMIIPWSISISATKQSGTVEFLIRFYLIDGDTTPDGDTSQAEFAYSLATLSAKSQVLKTLTRDDFNNEDIHFGLPERYFELIDDIDQRIGNSTLYWIEAEDLAQAE